MIVDRTRTELIATIRFLTDGVPSSTNPAPITGLDYSDPSVLIGYKLDGDTSWNDLTLVEGTLGTYTDSGLIEDSDSNGLYELGIPNAAKIAGKSTLWRFAADSNGYRYSRIDYVAIPGEEGKVKFSFNVPGSDIIFTAGDSEIYIKETGLEFDFVANQDIESETLVIIFETADMVDTVIVANGDITKVGDTATIDMPSGFADDVTSVNWAIREATTKRLYGTGSISVTYAPHED